MIPVAVLAVLLLPTPYLALALALILAAAGWEWAGLAGFGDVRARLAFALLVCGLMGMLWFLTPRAWYPWLLLPAVLWWLARAVALSRIERVEPASHGDPVLIPVGLLVLSATWIAIVYLHGSGQHGPLIVLFLMVLISLADTAAYFVGRRWGRRQLAPVLSPKKTLEGLLGGLAAATAWGLLLALALHRPPAQGLALVAICIAAAVLSVVGDLYESLLKRRRGVKDAGALLPGHGGVLDRIDSMTAAAPVFALGFLWLGGAL